MHGKCNENNLCILMKGWMKIFNWNFQEVYQVWEQTTDLGQRIQWLKCCECNNQDENAGPNNKAYHNENSSISKSGSLI